jgi:hypothetical protein
LIITVRIRICGFLCHIAFCLWEYVGYNWSLVCGMVIPFRAQLSQFHIMNVLMFFAY